MDLTTAKAIIGSTLGINDLDYYPPSIAAEQIQARIDYLTEALEVFKEEN